MLLLLVLLPLLLLLLLLLPLLLLLLLLLLPPLLLRGPGLIVLHLCRPCCPCRRPRRRAAHHVRFAAKVKVGFCWSCACHRGLGREDSALEGQGAYEMQDDKRR